MILTASLVIGSCSYLIYYLVHHDSIYSTDSTNICESNNSLDVNRSTEGE